MNIGIVSLFPAMFSALEHGISGRAISQKIVRLHYFNPRDYAHDKHRCVDDRPYGGGPGMVMTVQPLRAAINAAKLALGSEAKVIYLSPQGKRLDQPQVQHFAKAALPLIFIAGRYEGIDQRVVQYDVDQECSIGDYVLSGGEIPAMAVIDAIIRLLPGALGDEASAMQDSFMQGLLDCPHYTRPATIDGQEVPKVLLGGNHQDITDWRLTKAVEKTWQNRPDLFSTIKPFQTGE